MGLTTINAETLPSAQEMHEFAIRFNEKEWETLCSYQDFLKIISENIMTARVLAERILAGKHNGKRVDWRLNPYAK